MGDENDDWIIEIVNKKNDNPALLAMESVFRLKHKISGCYLMSRNSKLPKWGIASLTLGFEQQEVTCSERARYDLTLWRIELCENKDMPKDSPKVRYKKPSFFSSFMHLHIKMWNTNQALTDSHPYDSRPRNFCAKYRRLASFEKRNQFLASKD